MSERRWEPILPHLREFQHHLADHVAELRIEPASNRQWTKEQYAAGRKTGIFNQYGVYLIFAPDESLQYIGLAMYSFDKRIWSHDEYINRRWTDVIALPHAHYFLGPALEFFLICRLRPPMNRTYRGYTIPESPILSGTFDQRRRSTEDDQ